MIHGLAREETIYSNFRVHCRSESGVQVKLNNYSSGHINIEEEMNSHPQFHQTVLTWVERLGRKK